MPNCSRKYSDRYHPALLPMRPHRFTVCFTVCLETVAVILLVILAVLVTIVMLSPL